MRLTSFIFKTIEKLFDRLSTEEVLPDNPLHKNQYPYQSGKSTTHALQNLVNMLVKSIAGKEVAIGSFVSFMIASTMLLSKEE